MRLISVMILMMDSAPFSASMATSSDRRAVSLALLCTWSMLTSISFMDELEVSSAVSESASTLRATSLME
jgi:hypothetical protein